VDLHGGGCGVWFFHGLLGLVEYMTPLGRWVCRVMG
jgi:hypothetical protein